MYKGLVNNGQVKLKILAAPQKIKFDRYASLAQRTWMDIKIFFISLLFSARYLKNNKFLNLFLFREAIEVKQISPFRTLFANHQKRKPIPLKLPQFGKARIMFDLNDHFQMAICEEFVKYKIYDLSLVDFIPEISMDCGSYRGYFTFLVNDRFTNCKKICIEPHPGNYKMLLKTIADNGIQNIETINKALSKSPDTVVLELWGSNMALNDSKQGPQNLVNVETATLFNLLAALDPQVTLLLKVDIEGSELDFFPECIGMLPACCAVYLETHDGWNSLHSIKCQFEECGFRFSVLRDRGLYIDSFAIRS